MSSSNPRTGLPALWSSRGCVATLTATSASGNCLPSNSMGAGGNVFSAGRAAIAACAVLVSARVVPTSGETHANFARVWGGFRAEAGSGCKPDKRSSFVFDTLNPKGEMYAQEE